MENLSTRPVPVRGALAQLNCEILLHRNTLYNWIRNHPEKMPHFRKLGNRYLISPLDLYNFLKGLDLILERKE